MDRNKLSAILLMLMAVLGALAFLFILGGGLVRALLGGAETSGIVSVAGGSSVRLALVLVLAAVVIAVGVVIYRRVRR
jgi:hypothetical protein